MKKPYYVAYKERYKTVFEAGAKHRGHSSDDRILCEAMEGSSI